MSTLTGSKTLSGIVGIDMGNRLNVFIVLFREIRIVVGFLK